MRQRVKAAKESMKRYVHIKTMVAMGKKGLSKRSMIVYIVDGIPDIFDRKIVLYNA